MALIRICGHGPRNNSHVESVGYPFEHTGMAAAMDTGEEAQKPVSKAKSRSRHLSTAMITLRQQKDDMTKTLNEVRKEMRKEHHR